MSKAVIGCLYFLGIIVMIVAALTFYAIYSDYSKNMVDALNDQKWYGMQLATDDNYRNAMNNQPKLIVLIVLMILANISCITAWIGTLVNLGKARYWTWFALTFIFSGISIICYLIAGPNPSHKQPLPVVSPLSSSPQYGNIPGGAYVSPPQVYQPPQQLSALEILQQRFARGEIDAATYQQMRDMLKA